MNRRLLISKLLLAVGMLALAADASANSQLATFTIFPGENWISPPLVPFNPYPSSMFAGIDLNGKLSRWDDQQQTEVVYDSANPQFFGAILLGSGYNLRYAGSSPITVSYAGVPDGVPDSSGKMTDVMTGCYGPGAAWIGSCFNHGIRFDDVLVTDGIRQLSMNLAVQEGWLGGEWTTLDRGWQRQMAVRPNALLPHERILRPGYMYKVPIHVDYLLFIVPAYPVVPVPTIHPTHNVSGSTIPEPSGVVGLIIWFGGVGGAVVRRRLQRHTR